MSKEEIRALEQIVERLANEAKLCPRSYELDETPTPSSSFNKSLRTEKEGVLFDWL